MPDPYYTLGGKNAQGHEETPHITGEVKVHFLIYCSVCGTGLCKMMTITKSPKHNQNVILVQPCPTCLDRAKEMDE